MEELIERTVGGQAMKVLVILGFATQLFPCAVAQVQVFNPAEALGRGLEAGARAQRAQAEAEFLRARARREEQLAAAETAALRELHQRQIPEAALPFDIGEPAFSQAIQVLRSRRPDFDDYRVAIVGLLEAFKPGKVTLVDYLDGLYLIAKNSGAAALRDGLLNLPQRSAPAQIEVKPTAAK